MKRKIVAFAILALTLPLFLIGSYSTVSGQPAEPVEPNEPFDPNDPNTYQTVKVRPLTVEEEKALMINNLALEELVSRLLDRELRKQVVLAKRKLAQKMTIAELQEMKEKVE